MTEYHQTWWKTKGIFYVQNPHDLFKRAIIFGFWVILWGFGNCKGFFGRWKDMLIQWHAGACWNDFLMDALFQSSMSSGAASKDIPLDWRPGYQTVARHSSRFFPGISQVSCWKAPRIPVNFSTQQGHPWYATATYEEGGRCHWSCLVDALLDAHLCRHFVDIICWES